MADSTTKLFDKNDRAHHSGLNRVILTAVLFEYIVQHNGVSSKPLLIARLAEICMTSVSQLNSLMQFLLDRGLLFNDTDEERVEITDKGLAYLRQLIDVPTRDKAVTDEYKDDIPL